MGLDYEDFIAHQRKAGRAAAVKRWGARTREDRFWDKVDKNGPVMRPDLGMCWVWTASARGGYGRFRVGAVKVSAHRYAWELENGAIPEGLDALHSCDNPSCVRPAHLFLGDDTVNARDREEKDRGHHARGDRQGHSKLTDAQVIEIRSLYRAGARQVDLAERFGILQPAVSAIVLRKTWRHVA